MSDNKIDFGLGPNTNTGDTNYEAFSKVETRLEAAETAISNVRGIKSVFLNESSHLIITFTDDTTQDAGLVGIGTGTGGGSTTTHAAFTSSDQQSQPGSTLRFFQAKLNRVSTLTDISSNATIWDAANGLWALKLSAAGDGTAARSVQVTLTCTPLDNSGDVTQTVTVSLASIAQPAKMSESVDTVFTAAAGKKLESFPGFAMYGDSNTSNLSTDGNGYLVNDGSGNPSAAILVSPSSMNGQKGSITFGNTAVDGKAYVVLAANGYNNGLIFEVVTSGNQLGITQLFSIQGGGVGFVASYPPYSTPADDNNQARLVFSYSSDGKTLNVGAGSIANGPTIDLTKFSDLGPKFGFNGAKLFGNAPMSGGLKVTDIYYVDPLTSITVTGAPLYTSTNEATYALTWDKTFTRPTALQHRFDNGDWLTGKSIINDDGTISYTASASVAGALIAQFRPLNDTGVIVTAPSAVQYLYKAVPFELGYNAFGSNYYINGAMLNDWGKLTDFRPEYGIIFIPRADISTLTGQTDTVITDIGVTLTSALEATTQVVSSDPTTGHHVIRVLGDATENRGFGFSGTLTRFNVTRGGTTGKIAPEFAKAWAATTGMRSMDLSGANGPELPLNKDTDKHYMTLATGPFMPYQDIIDGAAAAMAVPNSKFHRLWHTFPVNSTDDYVRAFATYLRDNAPSTLEFVPTLGNENWNYMFEGTFMQMVAGVERGWYGKTATQAAPNPTKNLLQINGKKYASGGADNTDGPAANAGDWVLYNIVGVGAHIYEAKANLAKGTTIGANANWIDHTDIDLTVPSRRYHAYRFNQVIDIIRDVLGAARFATQVRPVVDGQADTPLSGYFTDAFAFVPGFKDKLAGAGFDFYMTPDGASSVSDLDAKFRTMFTTVKATTSRAVRDCIRLGLTPYFYEGCNNASYSSGNIVDDYHASDLCYNFEREVVAWFKANVPGVMMRYTYNGNEPWGLVKNWGDTQNKRYLGIMAGLAS